MSEKFRLAVGLTLLGAFLEVAMLTFLKGVFNPYISSLLLFTGGIVTGLAFLFSIKHIAYAETFGPGRNDRNKTLVTAVFFLVVCAIGIGYLQAEIAAFPITDYYDVSSGSDVIPQIGVLVDRFLGGAFPYEIINHGEWGFHHDLFPTYLPLTWMPFIIAEFTGLDYRVFAFLVLAAALAVYVYRFYNEENKMLPRIGTVILGPLFVFLFMQFDDEGAFRYGVETLIAGFYLLLSLSLLSSSKVFKAITLTLCLLSRYSLVLWIPLYFVILLTKEKKNTLFITLAVFVLFVLIYALPFLAQDPSIFIQGYDYHSDGAIAAWRLQAWQAEGDLPQTLYKGMGFGWFFYENIDGTLADKVAAYRLCHFCLSLGTVIALFVFYFKRKTTFDYRLFLLGSLKVYLVVFYNFIQIPFSYLFLVPLIVSIPIIGVVLNPSYSRDSEMLRKPR